jgi:RHS repeat-associated protein
MLNDMLGSTVAVKGDEGYSTTSMTAFGESSDSGAFFTGKPFIGELGYAFLMRSYRPENSKWQTADPMGYPDGWNQLAYCNNGVTSSVDLWGCSTVAPGPYSFHQGSLTWPTFTTPSYYNTETPTLSDRSTYALCQLEATVGAVFTFGRNAKHYLDDTGTRLTYSKEFVDSFFTVENLSTFQQLISDYITGLNFSGTVSFSSKTWNDGQADLGDPGANHWLSNQDFRYAFTGTATMLSDGRISVSYFINIDDFYMFDNSTGYAGPGLTDGDWYRMAVVGLARPYEIRGTGSEHKFIIE